MKGALAIRKPVATLVLSMSSTNIVSGAWTELIHAIAAGKGCSAFEVFNGGSSIISIATGASGSEVAIPYSILPGGSSILIPVEIPKGVRLSAETADGTTANSGYLVINFFQ